ncbi:unnamed protein product [Scytosiphon promiscuus]
MSSTVPANAGGRGGPKGKDGRAAGMGTGGGGGGSLGGGGQLGHGVIVGVSASGGGEMHAGTTMSSAHPHHDGGSLLSIGDGMSSPFSPGRGGGRGGGGRSTGGVLNTHGNDTGAGIHHHHDHHRRHSSTDSVVPRRSLSPLSLPTLPWPSPVMPASAGGGGGPMMDGMGIGSGGQDHLGRGGGGGRSTSPFGMLSGPPPGLGGGGRPLRGGTREPPVEAGAGPGHIPGHIPGHFRAPPGQPSSKRYRMSPPYMPRDMPLGQRPGEEYGIPGAPMGILSGTRIGSPERGGSGGGNGAPFLGTNYLSQPAPASSVYSQGSSVGSFDSSNALGAMLDGRHRGSNGFVRGGSRGRTGGNYAGVGGSGGRADEDIIPGGGNGEPLAYRRPPK